MIQTNRCTLTTLQNDDWELVTKLYTNIEVRHFLGGVVNSQNIHGKFLKMLEFDTETKHWVIRVKDNSFIDGIGIVSLTRHHNNIDTEISYQLLPEWWNKGYGAEVVKVVVNYALTVCGLPRVIAETQIDNTASCRLLKSIGMGLERTVERFGTQQGIFST
jgi:[ribosomal protein S5]-alanine N-acetyltransferase